MFALGALTAALGCASASVFQPADQKPLSAPQHDQLAAAAAVNIPYDHKPLVDSEELQAKISQDKLLARAKELYKIAELSLDEYNHPTRVIGSDGKSTR